MAEFLQLFGQRTGGRLHLRPGRAGICPHLQGRYKAVNFAQGELVMLGAFCRVHARGSVWSELLAWASLLAIVVMVPPSVDFST